MRTDIVLFLCAVRRHLLLHTSTVESFAAQPANSTPMPLHRPHHMIKSFSTSTPTPNTTFLNWRSQIKQSQLVSQISSILLQRHNWAPLLRTLNLSSYRLTPSLFLHILCKTKTNPLVSLSFFNWAKSSLGFEPDLKTLVTLSEILIGSGLARQAKPVLDALIKDNPPTRIVNLAVRTCRGSQEIDRCSS